MNMRHRQSGMSIIGVLCIAVMVGFFAMCAIRMTPVYLEYLTVKKVITKIATEPGAVDMTIADIRRKIANVFNTNQIYALQPRAVEVYRKEGKTYIDSGYEVRVPIAGRVNALLDFTDLVVIVGQATP